MNKKYDIAIFKTYGPNLPVEPILFTKKGETPPPKISDNEKIWQNIIIELLSNSLTIGSNLNRGCSFLAAARSGINLNQIRPLVINDAKTILPHINQIKELQNNPITEISITDIQVKYFDPTYINVTITTTRNNNTSELQITSNL